MPSARRAPSKPRSQEGRRGPRRGGREDLGPGAKSDRGARKKETTGVEKDEYCLRPYNPGAILRPHSAIVGVNPKRSYRRAKISPVLSRACDLEVRNLHSELNRETPDVVFGVFEATPLLRMGSWETEWKGQLFWLHHLPGEYPRPPQGITCVMQQGKRHVEEAFCWWSELGYGYERSA